MKKLVIAATLALTFAAGAALAERVHDWEGLEKAHDHVQEALKEMERAQAANHYDMGGHAAKAEELLRGAEREIHESVEAAKKSGEDHHHL